MSKPNTAKKTANARQQPASPVPAAPKTAAAAAKKPISWSDMAKASNSPKPTQSASSPAINASNTGNRPKSTNAKAAAAKKPPPGALSKGPSVSAASKKPPNPNKPTKGPVSLADMVIVATSKKQQPQQKSSTASNSKSATVVSSITKPSVASSTQGASKVVISKASGETVVRRGKEREEVKPKRPSKLKQVILEERKEKYAELKDTLGEDADADLDKRLEAHRAKLLKQGVKLALRTENQRQIERLKTVPKVAKDSASVAAHVHREQQREYCRQILTEDLDKKIYDLLSQLAVFQERLKATNPLKAKMRRRLIVGLREVTRAINLGKAKCVFMAPNIEDINSPNGLNDRIARLVQTAREKRIPFVFGLTLKKMGKALNKTLKVSVVAVLSADGAHEKLSSVLITVNRLQVLSAVQYKQQQAHMTQFFEFQALGLSLVDRAVRDGGGEALLQVRGPSAEIHLGNFSSAKQLAFRIDTNPDRVGSVTVIIKQLSAEASVQRIGLGRTVELPPYIIDMRGGSLEASMADRKHTFRTWKPVEGIFEVTATIYSEFNGKGDILSSYRTLLRLYRDQLAPDTQDDELSEVEEDDPSGSNDDESEEDQLGEVSDDDDDHSAHGEKVDVAHVEDTPLPQETQPADVSTYKTSQNSAAQFEAPSDRRTESRVEQPTQLPRRRREVDANDHEELERIRAEKRRKPLPLPPIEDDEDKPLPDYFEASLAQLLADPAAAKLLRPPASPLISSIDDVQEVLWTLFFKSPNETMRVLVLDGVSPSWTVQHLKEEVAKKFRDRPAKSMRLYFYHTLALKEDVIIGNVPRLCNYSTLLLLRKGQNVPESLAAL